MSLRAGLDPEARAEVLKPRSPRGGVVGPLGGGRVVCMKDIFILDEIWAQHKTYIVVGTLLG
jgi:hypothetical protein